MIDPGTSEFTEYERQYYSGYPYRFWFHKARAIYYFIEDVSRLQYLRAPNDIDTDDYIIDNLKMEIHMMLFHSAEPIPNRAWSLFLSCCTLALDVFLRAAHNSRYHEFLESKGT